MSQSSFPDVAGTVSLEGDALVVRRSPVRRLRSQLLRWRRGGVVERLLAVWSLLFVVLMPILAAWYLALALVLDPRWAAGPTRNLFWGVLGLVVVGLLVDQTLRPRRIPLSRLGDGVETAGPRTLRLPADAFGRLRAAVRLWTRPTLNFVRGEDRDRIASLLERRGVDVDRG